MSYSVIPCSEEQNSVQENCNVESGINCSVTVRCNFADRFLLIDDVLQNRRAWPHGGFNVAPQAYSCSSRGDNAKPVSVGQLNYYQHALITINYSTKIRDLVSESLEPTVEFLTEDFKQFRWGAADGDSLLEGEAPGRQFRGLNLLRTMYSLETVPNTVLTSVGNCNSSAYSSQLLGLTFGAETLLYHPPNLSRVIRSNGTEGFTLHMKFQYKPQGWNKYWRAKTQEWESIYLAGGDEYKSYPPGSFGSLLA